MKSFLSLLAITCLTGCVGVPGSVRTDTSTFDGSTSVSSEPAWVYNGMMSSDIMFALYRNSKMETNKVILTASASHNIASGPSLKFNINGEVVEMTSIDQTSDITTSQPYGVRCAKRYETTLPFIQRLVDATNVTVRLDLFRSYVEGRFTADGPTVARPAFRRFLATVYGTNTTQRPQPFKTGKGAN